MTEKQQLVLYEGISVDEGLVEKLKPHQEEGVKFMYNTIIGRGSGCVLSHCMGLGMHRKYIENTPYYTICIKINTSFN